MTEKGIEDPQIDPKTFTSAYYAQPMTVPNLQDPIRYLLREDNGLAEFERELERPIGRLELEPVLEFHAPGFDEVIAFNFNLDKVWPERIKQNMSPHRTPESLEGFDPCEEVREGVFQIPVALTPRVTAYINHCLRDDEYAVIKWDVLARTGDTWFFVDPGAGIKP